MRLADAHIHLFRHGYRRVGLPSLFGDSELAAYEALRQVHGVELALAIGYEAEGIDPDNNAYIRKLSETRTWLRTLAFVVPSAQPSQDLIDRLFAEGHSGLAVYAIDRSQAQDLLLWPREAWQALEARRAVISLNARPEALSLLKPLFVAYDGVAFLISHLGLPGTIVIGTSSEAVQERLKPLLELASLTNVHVKLSGFYATSEPPHDYPHGGAHHAVRAITDSFGPERCLWASDFAPALEFVSFPQTIHWPGLDKYSDAERHAIFSGNLCRLLSDFCTTAPGRAE